MGGRGELYERARDGLKAAFPFRKWKVGGGDFCGSMIRQDPHTKAITSGQSDYVEKMTKARTRQRAPAESPATPQEVAELQR
eukprot:9398062-Alexandrium_andersonii.AAC.1